MGTKSNNRVSKRYTNEETKQTEDAFAILKTMFDLGISLTDKERKDLPSVSKERMPYVQLGLKAAKTYPDVLARDFNEQAFEDDVALVGYLHDVLLKINDLRRQVEDVFMVAGSESYKAAGVVRDYMRANNKDNPVYKNMLTELDAYFKRTKAKTETETEEEAEELIEKISE